MPATSSQDNVTFFSESPGGCSSSRWLNPFVDNLLADFDALLPPDATTTRESDPVPDNISNDAETADEMLSGPVIVPGLFESSLILLQPSSMYPDGQDTSPFTKQLFDFCKSSQLPFAYKEAHLAR